MPTQNISITPELEKFVKAQVSSGYFTSVSEVHRAALTQMARQQEERELHLKRLRQDIQVGIDDIEAGRYTQFDSFGDLEKHLGSVLDEELAGSDEQST